MQQPLPLAEEHPLAGDPEADRKLQAISALLHCSTCLEAAQAAGLDRTTLSRWTQEPSFQRALDAARRDLQNQTLVALQSATAAVTNLFLATARDAHTPAPYRVRAAEAIVTLGHRARQSGLRRRTARIQHALEARQAPHPPLLSRA